MLPTISLNFFNNSFILSTNILLLSLTYLISLTVFMVSVKCLIDKLKFFIAFNITVFFSLLGARVFYLLFETSTKHINYEALTKFDGMTFYGSFFVGLITFSIMLFIFFKEKQDRLKLYDLAAICVAFSYGILRIGCFAGGCCWGKISAKPWTVIYYKSNVMPYLGVPVHPVQLYDSFFGFIIALLLIYFYRKNLFTGLLFPLFMSLYPIGRFVTEFFRGDSFRGEHILFGLSTSQTISTILFLFASFLFLKRTWSSGVL